VKAATEIVKQPTEVYPKSWTRSSLSQKTLRSAAGAVRILISLISGEWRRRIS